MKVTDEDFGGHVERVPAVVLPQDELGVVVETHLLFEGVRGDLQGDCEVAQQVVWAHVLEGVGEVQLVVGRAVCEKAVG